MRRYWPMGREGLNAGLAQKPWLGCAELNSAIKSVAAFTLGVEGGWKTELRGFEVSTAASTKSIGESTYDYYSR